MTQKTRSALTTQVNTQLANNVGGDISPTDVRGNVIDTIDSAVFNLDPVGQVGASTGWLSGGVITINADNTKFDYTAGSGIVTDASDPTAITHALVSWSSATAVVPTLIATQSTTFLAIDVNGALVQSATFPAGGALRDCIQLGSVIHGNNINITSTSDFVSATPFQIAASLTDLIIALGVIQVSGNDITGSGNGNLKFKKTAGVDFWFGIQAKAFPNNPNNLASALENEPNIIFSWRDGAGGFNTAVSDAITAGVYDNNTGGASAPSATITTNQWINVRIKYSPDSDAIFMEYGSTVHNSSASAVAGISNGFFGDNPSFGDTPVRGYLSIRGAAANLDIVGDAIFTTTNKFGLL